MFWKLYASKIKKSINLFIILGIERVKEIMDLNYEFNRERTLFFNMIHNKDYYVYSIYLQYYI